MFTALSELAIVLSRGDVLKEPSIRQALVNVAKALDDDDYRNFAFGEFAVAMARVREYEDAEKVVRDVANSQRSEYLRKVAAAEVDGGERHRAVTLLREAVSAALLNRFPVQQAQDTAAAATVLERIDEQEAKAAWHHAVGLASAAQNAGGTDGPEASGVLYEAAQAFVRLGGKDEARSVASMILIQSLKDQAMLTISS